MTLCDQIILYYDDPPEGEGIAEVLDTGFSIIPNSIFFPHAQQRLHLNDQQRVSALAQRFYEYECLTLEQKTHLTWRDGEWIYAKNVKQLMINGQCIDLDINKVSMS